MPEPYKVYEVKSVDELRPMFDGDYDRTLNWLFLSTSGYHGSYQTLEGLADAWPEDRDVTVLVVQPRLVSVGYGTIPVHTEEGRQWLAEVARNTLLGVVLSQAGNWFPKTPMEE